jgi:hypothetical protein
VRYLDLRDEIHDVRVRDVLQLSKGVEEAGAEIR